MYKYVGEITPLNKNEILKRVLQEEIFESVIGFSPVEYQFIHSPFRDKDKNAGAFFEYYNGVLYFKDFADPKRRVRDCFQVIMDKYNLTFVQSLEYINNRFSLGLNTNNAKTINETKTNEVKEKKDFIIKPRAFQEKDKKFWYDRYEITRSQLIEDNVFALEYFKFYNKKRFSFITIRAFLSYAFCEFPDARKKIYNPLNVKGNFKWSGNFTFNDVGSLNKLPKKGDKLVITKGYKDCRIIRNNYINSVWFQSESIFPSLEIIKDISLRFKDIIILFDNDKVGVEQSKKLLEIIKEYNKNVGERFVQHSDIKDISDLRHKKGKIELNNFIRKEL